MSATDEPAPARAAAPGRVQRLRAGLRVLGERVVLGAVAGGATALVLAWAGLPWRTALVAGGVGAVAVLLAAWVASTVPPVPGTPHTVGETSGTPGETPRGTPGEPGRSGPRRPAP
ncbi:hypothetical protein Q760_02090 [Cellulomonas cellasea DSM 20118]|uniref:Uncharacterized protein n=1 Tax=Cellulomonas cellasea DSM 20118 TaxID=1408250 RepID=A0A0A0B561_9CELL|nr:hypothetical protein [Cellulomonas cellasea]KGM01338.1 hypothetical protein Q760_02090 [Cellulomonas cellasea DSM 20118]